MMHLNHIQLVTLTWTTSRGEDKGQAIWTPDGETKFALTFVDHKSAKGGNSPVML